MRGNSEDGGNLGGRERVSVVTISTIDCYYEVID